MEIYLILLVATPPLMLINLLYVAKKVREDYKERRQIFPIMGALAVTGACLSLCILALSGFFTLMSV